MDFFVFTKGADMAEFTETPDFVFEEEIGFNTLVSQFENGVEQRRATRANSIRRFNLAFRNRTLAEMEAVRDFFLAKYGKLTSFTWSNPNDSVEYTVRFDDDSFKTQNTAYQVYDFSISLIQVL